MTGDSTADIATLQLADGGLGILVVFDKTRLPAALNRYENYLQQHKDDLGDVVRSVIVLESFDQLRFTRPNADRNPRSPLP